MQAKEDLEALRRHKEQPKKREITMSQYQIAVVVGSLRRDSINRKLAHALVRLAPAEFSFQFLEIGDLPLYNQDHDADPSAPVKRLKSEIAASSGLIFVSPEYNRSIPGVLKNALDNASRPYGQNAWAGKPAGLLGASPGTIGTALAQQHLRNVLSYLNVPTMCQPEAFIQIQDDFFDEAGNIANEGTRGFLQGWLALYVAWVKQHAVV